MNSDLLKKRVLPGWQEVRVGSVGVNFRSMPIRTEVARGMLRWELQREAVSENVAYYSDQMPLHQHLNRSTGNSDILGTGQTIPSAMRDRLNAVRHFVGPLVVSALTLVAVLLTLDPADARPNLPQGPGITLDESFNVQMGVYLVESLKSYGLAILHPQSVEEVFGDAGYNPDHPPLGRFWLGVFHEISRAVAPVESGDSLNCGDNPFVTIHARAGSAVAFALTVLLVGVFASQRWGRLAGMTSSISLAVMPRLFGHAHLASLETCMGLVWTAAILGTIQVWTRPGKKDSSLDFEPTSAAVTRPDSPGDKAALLCGLLIGLALLTKMQAVLLPPLIAVWAVWHWRLAAVRPLLVSGVSASVVFVAGWPWLWLDLPGHLSEYFGRSTGRVSLNVWYLGEAFRDVDVPWHYPWVMTFVTVPVGILLLAAVGMWGARRKVLNDPVSSLILGSVVAPLVLFSLPGVAVYDGARLFLVVFPGIAVLAGSSVVSIRAWQPRFKLPVTATMAVVLAAQTVGILSTTPYFLSYYNATVGGTAGAERLGFEVTYWGDSFSREFLANLKNTVGSNAVLVAPVLHQFQLEELERQIPSLARPTSLAGPRLVPFRGDGETGLPWRNGERQSGATTEYLAVFHRRADAPSVESIEQSGWEFVSSVSCQNVAVASLWRRTGAAFVR